MVAVAPHPFLPANLLERVRPRALADLGTPTVANAARLHACAHSAWSTREDPRHDEARPLVWVVLGHERRSATADVGRTAVLRKAGVLVTSTPPSPAEANAA